MTTNNNLIGKTARVTGRISPGSRGEIVISIGGGSETYHAYSDETFEVGSKVEITGHVAARTVDVVAVPSD